MEYEVNAPMAAEPESLADVLADVLRRIELLEDQVRYLNEKLNTVSGRTELAVEIEHHIVGRLQNRMGRP